jgi:phage baseplate assembly protein gpV
MMQKLGWEGGGLGSAGSGIQAPLTVKLRSQGSGLGY